MGLVIFGVSWALELYRRAQRHTQYELDTFLAITLAASNIQAACVDEPSGPAASAAGGSEVEVR
jgi:hypothetical protein